MERQGLKDSAQREVSQKWGAAQTFSGPFIVVPYETKITNSYGTTVGTEKHNIKLLPDKILIDGIISPEIKKRGIYKVILYQTDLNVSGFFPKPDLSALNVADSTIQWNKATINIGISDMGGIRAPIDLNWQNQQLELSPGTDSKSFASSGVSRTIDLSKAKEEDKLPFSFVVKLRGSQDMKFLPLGKETNVQLKSSWASPSFQGRFLPDSSAIDKDGFSAKWTVLDMNRNFPQQWIDDEHVPVVGSFNSGYGNVINYSQKGNTVRSGFGVRLLETVDEYHKNTRSAKYSLLIIVLTFMMYFFFEIVSKAKIHPLQYLLIGLAISLFYVLLLSLSEHFGFNLAYLTSAVATMFLIIMYSAAILKKKSHLGILSVVLILIYSFLFVLLQLEDYALVAGSIGLFIALFAVMYYSRNIDWYGLKKTTHD